MGITTLRKNNQFPKKIRTRPYTGIISMIITSQINNNVHKIPFMGNTIVKMITKDELR